MDIGLVLQNDPPAQRVIDVARRADASGYSHVWTFDSHVLWQEPFVVYAQILAQTSNVKVGPFVTNPQFRYFRKTLTRDTGRCRGPGISRARASRARPRPRSGCRPGTARS